MSIDRRQFVKGCTGVAAATALSGVATVARADDVDDDSDYASQVVETVDFDVAVVGAGPAGLSAGVQAAELGLSVIMLEAADFRGGTTIGAEGLSAVNSPLQQEQGIEFAISDVVDHMASLSEYKVNALFWKNMLERSGETIGWLIDHGVAFTGQVDDYKGDGLWPTFHWFEGQFSCPTAFGDPMEAAFTSSEGCELRLSTKGVALKMEDDKVIGLYAKGPDGVVEINAGAVILATGGYARNYEMIEDVYPTLHAGRFSCASVSAEACDGTGRLMALEAGAKEETDYATFMSPRSIIALTSDSSLSSLCKNEQGIWVNQDGSRYIREDAGSVYGLATPLNALIQQWETYGIIDAAIVESMAETIPDGVALLEAEVGSGEVFEGQTPEELAEAMGVDAAALAQTFADYNAAAAAGVDAGFGKDPAKLVALETPPFFALRQTYQPYKVLGSTAVNVKYEVIDEENMPIPGLYAVGTEANSNYYKSGYSYHCAGGACAQAVDSGREAAKNAAIYIGA